MKVIFLDFDGIITTVSSEFQIIPKKLEFIKTILDTTGAKIVLTTDWRTYDLQTTLKFIESAGFTLNDYVIDMVDRLWITSTKTNEFIPNVYRGIEIDYWLNTHSVKNFVIIDDMPNMLLDYQSSNTVVINPDYGITKKDVNKIIKILNG